MEFFNTSFRILSYKLERKENWKHLTVIKVLYKRHNTKIIHYQNKQTKDNFVCKEFILKENTTPFRATFSNQPKDNVYLKKIKLEVDIAAKFANH